MLPNLGASLLSMLGSTSRVPFYVKSSPRWQKYNKMSAEMVKVEKESNSFREFVSVAHRAVKLSQKKFEDNYNSDLDSEENHKVRKDKE